MLRTEEGNKQIETKKIRVWGGGERKEGGVCEDKMVISLSDTDLTICHTPPRVPTL
jgi:hypothetical protein